LDRGSGPDSLALTEEAFLGLDVQIDRFMSGSNGS
jgi:hypothetical protein